MIFTTITDAYDYYVEMFDAYDEPTRTQSQLQDAIQDAGLRYEEVTPEWLSNLIDQDNNEQETDTMNTQEQYTPDQLEAIADLDRMKAYQEEYPEAYREAYRELLNSPIDKAERVYANGYNRLGIMHTALRPIWSRETPPESMDADQWRTLAAIDRLYEYDTMARLA